MSLAPGASLPKAKQWATWLAHWLRDRRPGDGSRRFLLEAMLRLHALELDMARRLRDHAPWTGAGTWEDWMNYTERCERMYAWWLNEMPPSLKRLLDREPENDDEVERRKMAEATGGALAELVRLAREVDEVRDTHGIIGVNVNPHHRGDEFPEQ